SRNGNRSRLSPDLRPLLRRLRLPRLKVPPRRNDCKQLRSTKARPLRVPSSLNPLQKTLPLKSSLEIIRMLAHHPPTPAQARGPSATHLPKLHRRATTVK